MEGGMVQQTRAPIMDVVSLNTDEVPDTTRHCLSKQSIDHSQFKSNSELKRKSRVTSPKSGKRMPYQFWKTGPQRRQDDSRIAGAPQYQQ